MALYLIDEGDEYHLLPMGLFRGSSDPQSIIDKYLETGDAHQRKYETVLGKIEKAHPLPDPRKGDYEKYQTEARLVFARRMQAIEAKIGPDPREVKPLKQRLLDAGFEEVEYFVRGVFKRKSKKKNQK